MSEKKSLEQLKNDLEDAMSDANTAQSDAEDASQMASDALVKMKKVEEALKAYDVMEPLPEIPKWACFLIRIEDLAQAIYKGQVPALTLNGSGTIDDARVQAQNMLHACGMSR